MQLRLGERETVLHHVADIHNLEVTNMDREKLGSIETLIADAHNGRIVYGVVSVGGFLGIADTLVAVPWEAFQQRPMYEGLVLNMTRSQLEAAPQFDRRQWPNFGDEGWTREVHQYYGTTDRHRGLRPDRQPHPGMPARPTEPRQQTQQQIQQHLHEAFTRAGMQEQQARTQAQELAERIQQERPDQEQLQQLIQQQMTEAGIDRQRAQQEAQRTAQQIQPILQNQADQPRRQADQPQQRQPQRPTATAAQFVRTNELLNTTVENRQGETLGNFDNIAMEVETGEIKFAVVGIGGFLGFWQTHVTVPWEAMEITPRNGQYRVVLDVTKERLERAPEYDMDKWPEQRDVEWARDEFPRDRRPGERRDWGRDPGS